MSNNFKRAVATQLRVNKVASAIVSHVRTGGFLGASWPQYVGRGPMWYLGDDVLNAGMTMAEEQFPALWQESQYNLNAEV